MAKEIKMSYREYEALEEDRKQLKEALDAVKSAENVVVLDYTNITYRHNGMFASDDVIIPKIEGDGIGAYAEHKEKFEKDRERIETLASELDEEKFKLRGESRDFETARNALKDKTGPWKLAFIAACFAVIILIITQLIN